MSDVDYKYYLVESHMVARAGPGTTERLLRDGTWKSYSNRWRVLTEGVRLKDEEEALATAQELWEQEDRRKKP